MTDKIFKSTLNQKSKTFQVRGFKDFEEKTVSDLIIMQAPSAHIAVEIFLDEIAGDFDVIEVVGHGWYKAKRVIKWEIKKTSRRLKK